MFIYLKYSVMVVGTCTWKRAVYGPGAHNKKGVFIVSFDFRLEEPS